MSQPLLSVNGVQSFYGPIQALNGVDLEIREGEIVTLIQKAKGIFNGIIINAAGYTHTSVAIHDALRAFDGCKVELHISNPPRRELFRHISYVSTAVDAVVAGFGTQGYDLVIDLLVESIDAS